MVLNAFQVPLVHEHDNFLGRALINLGEQVLVTLVHEDFLKSGEEDLGSLSVPVNQMLIEALLGEGLRIALRNLLTVGMQFLTIEGLGVLEALQEVVGHIHASLVVEAICGLGIQLCSEELDIGTDLLSGFTSILYFKARKPEFEVKAKAIVEFECGPVCGESCKEDKFPNTPVVLKPVLASLLQVLLVSVQLFL